MNVRTAAVDLLRACLTAALCAQLQSVSRADITVVSNVTVTGQFIPTQREGSSTLIPYPQGDVTVYYHGDLERLEAGGTVTLFDTAKDRVTIINSTNKSYIVLPLKKTLAELNPPADPALASKVESNISVITNVSIAQQTDKKTIANREALKTTMLASADLMQESQSSGTVRGFGRGGGRGGYGRGGGSTGGGGQTPSPNTTGRRAPLPTYQVEGEYWMTGEIPGLEAGVKNKKELLTPSYLTTLAIAPTISTLVRPVTEKMAAVKGYPVMSRISISRVLTNQDSGTPPDPVVITTEVKSITEGALSESLFKVPDGYIEVKPVK